MSIKNIYLLPQTLLCDMDIWLRNQDINVKDIWNLIEKRFQEEIKFTKRELSDYMVERRQYLLAPELDTEAITLLPRDANTEMKESQDKSLDGEVFVNVRDRARLMHMLKEKLVRRMNIVEQAQKIDGKDYIDPYMESLVINYTKVLVDIVEKEVKLQLELEESSKLEKMISDRLNLVLFLIWKSTQKFLKKEYFIKFKNDNKRYEAFKNEIKEIFKNYGVEEHGKFE